MTVGSARHWIERWGARVMLALFACSTSSGASCADLVVSAATSLTNAFKEIGTLFSAANPGTHVAFNFASSDILLAQIVKGAPADVFAAADQDAMDRAEQSDSLLRGSRRDFATNRLVVIVPAGAAPMSALSDLSGRQYARIAVGSPQSVPAGRYAKGALERAGLWDRLMPRFVYATNVRQALDYVARQEANAGFVYATDAAIFPGKVKVALDVPTTVPIRYPIAATRTTRMTAEARAFIDFLATPPAQQILVRYGFGAATPQ
jgi:molybdate transport system substrate-binding protein